MEHYDENQEGNGGDKTDTISFGNFNYVAFRLYEGRLIGFIKLHDGNTVEPAMKNAMNTTILSAPSGALQGLLDET